MPEIKANPSALEASASLIETNVSVIRRELLAADELLANLRRTFIGQRAESFFRQYTAAFDEMQAQLAVMGSLAESLRQSAQALRAADQG
jgi:WXG100 family type VII secretion target